MVQSEYVLIALSVNAGSSSLKVALFGDDDPLKELDRKVFENTDVLKDLVDWVASLSRPPDVIGHRIVHGGTTFTAPIIIDEAHLESLNSLQFLAPLHTPAALKLISNLRAAFPNVTQVACFDTAFHSTLPRVAHDLSLPQAMAKQGLRKYGFHGLNCEHVISTCSKEETRRCIIAHLGSGCSVTGVVDGKSVDTTMGFTPNSGIPMGTRIGDIDTGLVTHLISQGHGAKELEEILGHKSGLLGWSGESADMRVLIQSGSASAQFAIDAFCSHVAKAIAAISVSTGGFSTLIFTGGIGEHAPEVRSLVLSKLSRLPSFKTLIVPANEELQIAKHAQGLLLGKVPSG